MYQKLYSTTILTIKINVSTWLCITAFPVTALWAKRLCYGTFAWTICLSAHVSSGHTRKWIGMPFGVVSGVGLRSSVLDFGGDRRRGRGSLGWIKCKNGVLCEKLTIFPYAECIVEFCAVVAFLWYSQVQDRIGSWREIQVRKRAI